MAPLTDAAAATRPEPVVELVADAVCRRRIGGLLAADGLHVLRERPDQATADADAVVVVLAATDDVACDLVSALRSRTEGVALVVVVPAADHASVRRLLDVGVDAVVDEAEAAQSLPSAVRAACCGLIALPRSYRERFGRPT